MQPKNLFTIAILYFLTGRPWPVAFGTGIGIGSAFSNCQHEFKNENIFHGTIKPVSKSAQNVK